MTQTKAKRGFFGKVLAAACSVALVASLTPAAAMTAFAAASTTDTSITVKVQGTDEEGTVFKMFNATISAGDFAGTTPGSFNFFSGSAWASATGTGYDLKALLGLAEADSGTYKGKSADEWYNGTYNPTIKIEGKATGDFKGSVSTTFNSLKNMKYRYTTTVNAEGKSVLQNVGTYGNVSPMVLDGVKIDGVQTNGYTFVQPMPAWETMSNENAMRAIGANRIVSNVKTITLTVPYSEFTYAKRIAGETWADTMVATVKDSWKQNANANIIVTTSANYADALAASGMAGVLQCPVIMTEPAALTEQTSELIDWLAVAGGSNVYVIGGPVVVSDATLDAIQDLNAVKDVTRIWGKDADATAVEIYEWVADSADWNWGNTYAPIVCTSATFKDALCAAPMAYAKSAPIFLTNAQLTLSNNTIDAITDYTDNVWTALTGGGYASLTGLAKPTAQLVGGPAVISESVDKQLLDEDVQVDRVWGMTEFQTSSQFAAKVVAVSPANAVAICTSIDYYDALSAINWCGTRTVNISGADVPFYAPVLLVDNDNTYSLTNFLQNYGPNGLDQIKSAKVFGGKVVVDTSVQALADSVLTPNIEK